MTNEQTEAVTELHLIGEAKPAVTIDVVFIHGIGGDPFATWTGGATDKDAFWPRWLDAAIPEAQVWTAHYPAQLSRWFGPSFPLLQSSTALLDRLTQRIGNRPIVFVCHSLGGLIAKQMLRASYDSPAREDFRQLGENVVGIVFLGTPHQGAFLASVARSLARALGIVARLSGFTETAAELAKENAYLENLGDWFRSKVAERRSQVLVYAESLPTKGTMIVDNQSANPGLVNVRSIAMALNHFQLAGPRRHGDQISDGVIKFVRGQVRVAASQSNKLVPPLALTTAVPGLTYLSTTEIDTTCISALRSVEKPPEITFFDDIAQFISTLEERNQHPDYITRQHPDYQEAQNRKEKELVAMAVHADIARLLRNVREKVSYFADKLGLLLVRLSELEASEAHATKSLRTFATLSALDLVKTLKPGYDVIDGKLYNWFESYKFTEELTWCLLDRVPLWSYTGKRVFGYGNYIIARVGNEARYEHAMFPLPVALPLFQNETRGDVEAFYTWVLPQLFIHPSSWHGPENFPTKDYEVFLLQGAWGKEWWGRFQKCPWPDAVASANMEKL